MNTTPQPEGWIIVNGNTDALDWDGDLHPTKEDAIQSLTGPYQDYCREGEEVDGKHPWSDGYQILPVYREPLPKPERMASERPGGTNADTREASAVSQSPHTLVLTDNGGGLMTMRIECSATPDAPCRRRPPDWMDRESWTDETGMSDTATRDQLVRIINGIASDEWRGDWMSLADAILAAGWRPPARTASTVEELDTLPERAIIIAASQSNLTCLGSDQPDWGGNVWQDEEARWVGSGDIDLPATVVWEPEVE